jgi:hypothetical protein
MTYTFINFACDVSEFRRSCFKTNKQTNKRSRWLSGLRCSSAAAHVLGSWVRTPPGAWILCFCCVFCVLLFNCVNYVFLLLCLCILLLFRQCSVYSVSLCCSVYCLCVNVYCTTATGCQPNCSLYIYIYIYIKNKH